MSSTSTQELQQDVDELRKFMEQSKRQKVKDTLSVEIRKLETEIGRRKEVQNSTGSGDTIIPASPKPTAQIKPIYTRQLDSYGWDQSDKFLKLYVTVEGVENIPKENVVSEFNKKTMKLKINDLNKFNYELKILNLLNEIVPADSYIKIKTGSVLVMLKKAEAGEKWSTVTQQDKKIKEKPSAAPAKPDMEDPNAGMMNMLQKMYDDGDDEMKRTISKAMYESRNKSGGAGDMPGMPPGMPPMMGM